MAPVDLLLGGLAVVAGAIAAVAGFGIGSLLTPALAAGIGTKAAVAVVAVPHLVATATASAILVDAARIPIYAATSGADIAAHVSTVVVLTVGVIVGTILGTPILRRMPEPVFRRLLSVLLIALGVMLIVGIGQ